MCKVLWLCFLTADWVSTGLTFSWLHFLPLLCGCCSALYLAIANVRRKRTTNSGSRGIGSTISTSTSRFWSKSRNVRTRIEGGISYWPVWFCALTVVCLSFVAYSMMPKKYEYVTNVHILKRTSEYNWKYEVMDPDTREWREFSWTGCHDYIPTHEIQAGATLLWIKYKENKVESCQEVGYDNLGYKLWRDENDKPILTALPRQTATSNTSY